MFSAGQKNEGCVIKTATHATFARFFVRQQSIIDIDETAATDIPTSDRARRQ